MLGIPYCPKCGVSSEGAYCLTCGDLLSPGAYPYQSQSAPPQTAYPPPQPGQPQYYNPYQYNQYQPYPQPYPMPQRQDNTLGIISLILGIVSFFTGIIFSVLAIVVGYIGMKRDQKYALAGLVLGVITLILNILLLIFFFSMFALLT